MKSAGVLKYVCRVAGPQNLWLTRSGAGLPGLGREDLCARGKRGERLYMLLPCHSLKPDTFSVLSGCL